jgi:hypothetical protein
LSSSSASFPLLGRDERVAKPVVHDLLHRLVRLALDIIAFAQIILLVPSFLVLPVGDLHFPEALLTLLQAARDP